MGEIEWKLKQSGDFRPIKIQVPKNYMIEKE
ncbi:hypothetical protein P872_08565 [Rhodonellum psychrophilum GCM71 = DSM 17998]|uniref:Uncharacterized protein n=1 Tax=Rhodonellum psychrophilum GCM71 = DSM 17998 TaxID=1123057 RepID=U5C1Q5_9BACT|nr:hypothetical protein P872_08565 [Rhodonellum psychrophilum GCM71 = DSM 17998]